MRASQCRLRGKIDSNGCVAAFLEERLNMGLNFILSAEVSGLCFFLNLVVAPLQHTCSKFHLFLFSFPSDNREIS